MGAAQDSHPQPDSPATTQPSFTPGPWQRIGSRIIAAGSDNLTIANVAVAYDGDYSPANGDLLAASPSLYAYAKADQLARELIAADDAYDAETIEKCIDGLAKLGWNKPTVDFANDLVKWLEQLRATALALAEGGGK